MMKRPVLATVILGAVALRAGAQPPREPVPAPASETRTVTGRVLADQTGDAIANARVTLVPSGQGTPVVLTDREGRFSLTAPLTRAAVTASKTGYSRREVIAAPQDESIEIHLSRGAAVSGHVIDEFGEPVLGARIEARALQADKKPITVATADTDDRGEYRLGGLGQEPIAIVMVTSGAFVRREVDGGGFSIEQESNNIYYPASPTAANAQTLRLRAGEERPAIDFISTNTPGSVRGAPDLLVFPNGVGPSPRSDVPSTPAPTGVIRGNVVSTDGRAIPRAQVRLVPLPPQGLTGPALSRLLAANSVTTADDDGHYEFHEIAAGTFRMIANKTGYSTRGGPPPPPGGSPAPGGPTNALPPIQLADGETVEHADITLARWGSLEGHVFDELGDPMQGVNVQLMQVRYQGGRRRLVPAGGPSRSTDDRGRFRLYGFAPGQYIVSAAIGGVGSADLPGYTRVYYPGTPDAMEAQFVQVGLSDDVTGVDFALSRSPTARVSGLLLNSEGEPTTGGSLRLVTSQRSASAASVSVGARIGSNGRFEFPNVPPGQYIIQSDRGRRNSSIEGEFGMLPVSVDGADITGLILQTSAGSTISGHVAFESVRGIQLPRPSQLQIQPVPVDPDQSPMQPADAAIHDDWSFDVSGINGPRRLRLLRVPSGWTLKEIRAGGIDVSDQALAFGRESQSLADVEVTLTDRITDLSGTIVDGRSRPAPASRVIVFSSDRDRWYPTSRFVRQSVARADGTFMLAGLPPGSYYAAVVAKLPTDGEDSWQDPAYLEALVVHATAFTLGEGQQHVLNLKLP
jgi:hypothetical protein